MDNTADMLGLLTRSLATLAGSGSADPAGNAANVTAVQALVASAATLLSNPMSASGDVIYGSSGGSPARLAKGSNGQALTLAGGLPAWVSLPAATSGIRQPSGDTTGVTDANNILGDVTNNGYCWLAAGQFYVKVNIVSLNTSALHKALIMGCGAGTVINGVGSGTGTNGPGGANATIIYMHGSGGPSAGANPALNPSGTLRDLVIDGTNCGANVTALDVGDGWGFRLDHLFCQNFSGSGSIGVRIGNDSYFTEKMAATGIVSRGNSTQVYMDSTFSTDVSHGYCDLDFYLYNQPGFNALTVAAGVNLYGGSLKIRGNHDTSNTKLTGNWIIGITGTFGGRSSTMEDMFLDIRMEGNQGNTYSATKLHFGNSGNHITNSFGMIEITGPADGNGVMTDGSSGQLAFAGIVGTSGTGSMQAIRTSPADGWFT